MDNPILRRKIIAASLVVVTLFLVVAIIFIVGGVRNDAGNDAGEKAAGLEMSSESLKDGVWQDAVASSGAGENKSPQLSFGPVEGAACYVIYMFDETAQNWVHWYAETTETDLPAGANPGQYKGPYPPKGSGDHTYTIWVYALGDQFSPDKKDIKFDAPGLSGEKLLEKLSARGSVLGYGTISGTYSSD